MEEMMAVRNAMVRPSTDLRQPLNLGEQLMNRSGLDQDVGQAMVDLLQVCLACTTSFAGDPAKKQTLADFEKGWQFQAPLSICCAASTTKVCMQNCHRT